MQALKIKNEQAQQAANLKKRETKEKDKLVKIEGYETTIDGKGKSKDKKKKHKKKDKKKKHKRSKKD